MKIFVLSILVMGCFHLGVALESNSSTKENKVKKDRNSVPEYEAPMITKRNFPFNQPHNARLDRLNLSSEEKYKKYLNRKMKSHWRSELARGLNIPSISNYLAFLEQENLEERTKNSMIGNVSNLLNLAIKIQEFTHLQSNSIQRKKALLEIKKEQKAILEENLSGRIESHPRDIASNSYTNLPFKEKLKSILREQSTVNSNYSLGWSTLNEAINYSKGVVKKLSEPLHPNRVTLPPPDSIMYPNNYLKNTANEEIQKEDYNGMGSERNLVFEDPNLIDKEVPASTIADGEEASVHKEHYHKYDDKVKQDASYRRDKKKLAEAKKDRLKKTIEASKSETRRTQIIKKLKAKLFGLVKKIIKAKGKINKVALKTPSIKAHRNVLNKKLKLLKALIKKVNDASNKKTRKFKTIKTTKKIVKKEKKVAKAVINVIKKLAKKVKKLQKEKTQEKAKHESRVKNLKKLFKKVITSKHSNAKAQSKKTTKSTTPVSLLGNVLTTRVQLPKRLIIVQKPAPQDVSRQERLKKSVNGILHAYRFIQKLFTKLKSAHPSKQSFSSGKEAEATLQAPDMQPYDKILTDFIHFKNKSKLKIRPLIVLIVRNPYTQLIKREKLSVQERIHYRGKFLCRSKKLLAKVLVLLKALRKAYRVASDPEKKTLRGLVNKLISREAKLRFSIEKSRKIIKKLTQSELEDKKQIVDKKERLLKFLRALAYKKLSVYYSKLKSGTSSRIMKANLVFNIFKLRKLIFKLMKMHKKHLNIKKSLGKKIVKTSKAVAKAKISTSHKEDLLTKLTRKVVKQTKTLKGIRKILTLGAAILSAYRKRHIKAKALLAKTSDKKQVKKLRHVIAYIESRENTYMRKLRKIKRIYSKEILKGKLVLYVAKKVHKKVKNSLKVKTAKPHYKKPIVKPDTKYTGKVVANIIKLLMLSAKKKVSKSVNKLINRNTKTNKAPENLLSKLLVLNSPTPMPCILKNINSMTRHQLHKALFILLNNQKNNLKVLVKVLKSSKKIKSAIHLAQLSIFLNKLSGVIKQVAKRLQNSRDKDLANEDLLLKYKNLKEITQDTLNQAKTISADRFKFNSLEVFKKVELKKGLKKKLENKKKVIIQAGYSLSGATRKKAVKLLKKINQKIENVNKSIKKDTEKGAKDKKKEEVKEIVKDIVKKEKNKLSSVEKKVEDKVVRSLKNTVANKVEEVSKKIGAEAIVNKDVVLADALGKRSQVKAIVKKVKKENHDKIVKIENKVNKVKRAIAKQAIRNYLRLKKEKEQKLKNTLKSPIVYDGLKEKHKESSRKLKKSLKLVNLLKKKLIKKTAKDTKAKVNSNLKKLVKEAVKEKIKETAKVEKIKEEVNKTKKINNNEKTASAILNKLNQLNHKKVSKLEKHAELHVKSHLKSLISQKLRILKSQNKDKAVKAKPATLIVDALNKKKVIKKVIKLIKKHRNKAINKLVKRSIKVNKVLNYKMKIKLLSLKSIRSDAKYHPELRKTKKKLIKDIKKLNKLIKNNNIEDKSLVKKLKRKYKKKAVKVVRHIIKKAISNRVNLHKKKELKARFKKVIKKAAAVHKKTKAVKYVVSIIGKAVKKQLNSVEKKAEKKVERAINKTIQKKIKSISRNSSTDRGVKKANSVLLVSEALGKKRLVKKLIKLVKKVRKTKINQIKRRAINKKVKIMRKAVKAFIALKKTGKAMNKFPYLKKMVMKKKRAKVMRLVKKARAQKASLNREVRRKVKEIKRITKKKLVNVVKTVINNAVKNKIKQEVAKDKMEDESVEESTAEKSNAAEKIVDKLSVRNLVSSSDVKAQKKIKEAVKRAVAQNVKLIAHNNKSQAKRQNPILLVADALGKRKEVEKVVKAQKSRKSKLNKKIGKKAGKTLKKLNKAIVKQRKVQIKLSKKLKNTHLTFQKDEIKEKIHRVSRSIKGLKKAKKILYVAAKNAFSNTDKKAKRNAVNRVKRILKKKVLKEVRLQKKSDIQRVHANKEEEDEKTKLKVKKNKKVIDHIVDTIPNITGKEKNISISKEIKKGEEPTETKDDKRANKRAEKRIKRILKKVAERNVDRLVQKKSLKAAAEENPIGVVIKTLGKKSTTNKLISKVKRIRRNIIKKVIRSAVKERKKLKTKSKGKVGELLKLTDLMKSAKSQEELNVIKEKKSDVQGDIKVLEKKKDGVLKNIFKQISVAKKVINIYFKFKVQGIMKLAIKEKIRRIRKVEKLKIQFPSLFKTPQEQVLEDKVNKRTEQTNRIVDRIVNISSKDKNQIERKASQEVKKLLKKAVKKKIEEIADTESETSAGKANITMTIAESIGKKNLIKNIVKVFKENRNRKTRRIVSKVFRKKKEHLQNMLRKATAAATIKRQLKKSKSRTARRILRKLLKSKKKEFAQLSTMTKYYSKIQSHMIKKIKKDTKRNAIGFIVEVVKKVVKKHINKQKIGIERTEALKKNEENRAVAKVIRKKIQVSKIVNLVTEKAKDKATAFTKIEKKAQQKVKKLLKKAVSNKINKIMKKEGTKTAAKTNVVWKISEALNTKDQMKRMVNIVKKDNSEKIRMIKRHVIAKKKQLVKKALRSIAKAENLFKIAKKIKSSSDRKETKKDLIKELRSDLKTVFRKKKVLNNILTRAVATVKNNNKKKLIKGVKTMIKSAIKKKLEKEELKERVKTGIVDNTDSPVLKEGLLNSMLAEKKVLMSRIINLIRKLIVLKKKIKHIKFGNKPGLPSNTYKTKLQKAEKKAKQLKMIAKKISKESRAAGLRGRLSKIIKRKKQRVKKLLCKIRKAMKKIRNRFSKLKAAPLKPSTKSKSGVEKIINIVNKKSNKSKIVRYLKIKAEGKVREVQKKSKWNVIKRAVNTEPQLDNTLKSLIRRNSPADKITILSQVTDDIKEKNKLMDILKVNSHLYGKNNVKVAQVGVTVNMEKAAAREVVQSLKADMKNALDMVSSSKGNKDSFDAVNNFKNAAEAIHNAEKAVNEGEKKVRKIIKYREEANN